MKREVVIAGGTGAILIALFSALPIPPTLAIVSGIVILWGLLSEDGIKGEYAVSTSLTYIFTAGFLRLYDVLIGLLLGDWASGFAEYFSPIEIQALFFIGILGLVFDRFIPPVVGSLTGFHAAWEVYKMGSLRTFAPIGIPAAIVGSILLALLPSFFLTEALQTITTIASAGFLLSMGFLLDSRLTTILHSISNYIYQKRMLSEEDTLESVSLESLSDEEFLNSVEYVLNPAYAKLEYRGTILDQSIVLCGWNNSGTDLFLVRRFSTLPESSPACQTEIYRTISEAVNRSEFKPSVVYFITDMPLSESVIRDLVTQDIKVIDAAGLVRLRKVRTTAE